MTARLSPSLFAVLLAAAASLPAVFTLSPNVDSDTWWHLRVGQLVRESGTVPETDPFSRMGRETPVTWLAYSWLYELGLFQVYSFGGLTGLMVARSVMCAASAAAVLAFAARRGGLGANGVLLAVLSAVVLMPFARERPWHVTIVLTVVTLVVVQHLREGEWGRWVWWLPVGFVLWANLHIQFVLGWLVLGLACLFPGSADRKRLGWLTAVCVVATFVNPYHVRLLGVIWDYATQTSPLRTVHELAPPDFGSVWTWATLGMIGWSVLRVVGRRPVDWFAVALLAVGLFLSMRMRRDLWFGAVAAIAAFPPGPNGSILRLRIWIAVAVVVSTFLMVRFVHFAGFGPPNDFAAGVGGRFPERAATAVRELRLPGPLYNPFDWGGYLIWALPEHPVSVDGRTNLYGSERIDRAMNTWVGGPGWETDPDLKSANLVVAPSNWPLTGLLRQRSDEWAVAFEDATAVVFTRVRR